MKKIVFLISLLISFNDGFGQDWITDSNFDDKIHEKSAFGDDEMSIVIVEFWAKFNDANSFQDWDKVKGITHYYRIDIAKAPNAKKEYRIRMAPTIIVFKDGIKEEMYKAGLDLECPVTLDELQEHIDEIKSASQFQKGYKWQKERQLVPIIVHPQKKGRVYTQKPKPQEVKEVNTIRRNIADKEDETYRYTQFEIHEIYG